ncbi:DUF3515 family protein [Glaciihabitans sp. UYNi722]|uniref:DUF3515 family protein n=1 Tax=Glaciihabitans sp. UYNi722 TaxID=3156344 RepID=UPI003396C208
MNSKLRAGALLAIVPLILATLAACAPTVALEPAAHATNPGCAEIIVRLPDSVDNQAIRQTNAQATGAWGNPTSVLLRCGVAPPGPTAAACYTLKGIDWLVDDSKAPRYVFTTFGRDPATEVIVDSSHLTSGTAALLELANAIGSIKQTKECTTREDVLGGSGSTSTPGN